MGESVDPRERLVQHNSGYFKGSSTSLTSDWQLKKVIELKDIVDARKIERYIKSMKSRRFIVALIEDDSFYADFKTIVLAKFSIIDLVHNIK